MRNNTNNTAAAATTTYFSQTVTNWSSEPRNGVYGTRNHVELRNGKGFRIHESLNRNGNPIKQTKKAITSSPRRETRKSPRRKESSKNK